MLKALVLHHRKYRRLHLSGKKKLLYKDKHRPAYRAEDRKA